ALSLNAALHYTRGRGFYEEYRYDAKFADYGISDIVVDDDGDPTDNTTISSTDLIRRRWLDNHFYGTTWSINYDKGRWNTVVGGAWNEYDGDHFGEVLWSEQGHIPHEHRYYFNNGKKRDFNTYAKVNYQISDRF